MKLQLVLDKDETEKWKEIGENGDTYRTTIRTIVRQSLTSLFDSIDIVNDKSEIVETVCVKRVTRG